MEKLHNIYRRCAPLSPILIMAIIWVAYPASTGMVLQVLFGIVSWIVGLLSPGFSAAIRFAAVTLAIMALLTVWCAFRARRAVIRACSPAGTSAWSADELRRTFWADTAAVAVSVIVELALPVFIALVLLFMAGEISVFLSAGLAIPDLPNLSSEWFDFGRRFADGGWHQPDWLVTGLRKLSQAVWKAAEPVLERLAATFTAAVGGVASLLIFLFRRRQTNLDTARIAAAEVTALVSATMSTVPPVFADPGPLLTFDRRERRILPSTDRELLLLDSSGGQVVKLPACLLESVVFFLHADLNLNQMWSSLGSQEFAIASPARRQTYLDRLEASWYEDYKPAALAVLFRLHLYQRLRAWTI